MSNVKIWSLLLTIFLTVIQHERICSSHNEKQVLNSMKNGNIGCHIEDVCLSMEVCINDYLFGKCIDLSDLSDSVRLKTPSVALMYLEYIIGIFGSNIDWRNPHIQCVLQNIISRSNIPSDEYTKRIVYLCTTDIIDGSGVDKMTTLGKNEHDGDKIHKYSIRSADVKATDRSYRAGKIYTLLNDNGLSVRDAEFSAIIPRKRRYRLTFPMDPEPLRPPTKSWVWVRFYGRPLDTYGVQYFLKELSKRLALASPITHYFFDRTGKILYFHVPTDTGTNAESVGSALRSGVGDFDAYHVADIGFGRGAQTHLEELQRPMKNYTTVLILCLSFAVFSVILFLTFSTHFCWTTLRNRAGKNSQLVAAEELNKGQHPETIGRRLKLLLQRIVGNSKEDNVDCLLSTEEQLTQSSVGSGPSPTEKEVSRSQKVKQGPAHVDSLTSQSSTSSWSSEPVSTGIDIAMGHLILSYMEDYINNQDKLAVEWNITSGYESEEATPCDDAEKVENVSKNRSDAPVPYEQSRVRLRNTKNGYINASLIYDSNPRNPGYIATPTPTVSTAVDFWTMVWEQSCAVLVCLERLGEFKQSNSELFGDASFQYWPNEGKVVCGQFEIHLVSEHSWCENYVVRSFYLKTLATQETRTVTQFHYLTWSDENLLTETRQLLEFRRKVNRSFRGMMSPIVVHCRDGCGRTGAYILLDLVLNRITKGLKEINIAASLEHLRDQRQKMVQNKEQYEFVFTAVAREVDAMLKAHHQTGQ